MPKIQYSFIWGVFVTIIFITLLIIRLEIVPENREQTTIVPVAADRRPADTWMNIYQNDKKIGFVHRTFTRMDKGFHFAEEAFMQINALGVIQALTILTEGDLNYDMTISSFNFNLTSGIFRFNAHGSIVKNKLIIFTGLPGSQEKSEIPVGEIPHMSGGVYDAAFAAKLEKDTTGNFSIFDPSTLAMRQVKVTRNADEIIPVMGKRTLTQKYCADFMGARNCAWLNKNGETLKETGMLGLSLEKVSPEEARKETAKDGIIDFTQAASIPANVAIQEPVKLTGIKLKITGIGHMFFYVNGGRQHLRKDVLTITRETPSPSQRSADKLPPELAVFLKATPLIQAGDPAMKQQVDNIVKPGDPPEQKISKIVNWVYRHIEKKPSLSVPNALEVLKNKTGDCNEHAVLVAALLRTAGIPAQIETGLVYLRGRFYYHAWNIAYADSWLTADAVFNQVPADVTHIRLIRGESDKQLDLIGVMGKIKIDVLEQTK